MMTAASRPISFYQFLRENGFDDQGARELIQRHNSYREQAIDKTHIKRYAQYLRDYDREVYGV